MESLHRLLASPGRISVTLRCPAPHAPVRSGDGDAAVIGEEEASRDALDRLVFKEKNGQLFSFALTPARHGRDTHFRCFVGTFFRPCCRRPGSSGRDQSSGNYRRRGATCPRWHPGVLGGVLRRPGLRSRQSLHQWTVQGAGQSKDREWQPRSLRREESRSWKHTLRHHEGRSHLIIVLVHDSQGDTCGINSAAQHSST